jgi:hypothetical protein
VPDWRERSLVLSLLGIWRIFNSLLAAVMIVAVTTLPEHAETVGTPGTSGGERWSPRVEALRTIRADLGVLTFTLHSRLDAAQPNGRRADHRRAHALPGRGHLGAVEVTLTDEQRGRLEQASAVDLEFPPSA